MTTTAARRRRSAICTGTRDMGRYGEIWGDMGSDLHRNASASRPAHARRTGSIVLPMAPTAMRATGLEDNR